MRSAAALLLALVALAIGACGSDDDTAGGGEQPATGANASGGKEQAQGADGKSGQSQAGGGKADEATVETIRVQGGEPVGGVRELEFSSGDQVRFRVRSDVADEIHVHGYDLTEDVKAGGTAALSFPADIEGIFEVELEDQQLQIAELRVNP